MRRWKDNNRRVSRRNVEKKKCESNMMGLEVKAVK